MESRLQPVGEPRPTVVAKVLAVQWGADMVAAVGREVQAVVPAAVAVPGVAAVAVLVVGPEAAAPAVVVEEVREGAAINNCGLDRFVVENVSGKLAGPR